MLALLEITLLLPALQTQPTHTSTKVYIYDILSVNFSILLCIVSASDGQHLYLHPINAHCLIKVI